MPVFRIPVKERKRIQIVWFYLSIFFFVFFKKKNKIKGGKKVFSLWTLSSSKIVGNGPLFCSYQALVLFYCYIACSEQSSKLSLRDNLNTFNFMCLSEKITFLFLKKTEKQKKTKNKNGQKKKQKNSYRQSYINLICGVKSFEKW